MVSNSPSAQEGIARPMPTYYITPPREKQEGNYNFEDTTYADEVHANKVELLSSEL